MTQLYGDRIPLETIIDENTGIWSEQEVFCRQKQYVFTVEDEAAFSELLGQTWPEGRFTYSEPADYNRTSPHPMTMCRSMAECPPLERATWSQCGSDWRPRFVPFPMTGGWRLVNRPYPFVSFTRSAFIQRQLPIKDGYEPRFIGVSSASVWGLKENKEEHLAFCRKFFKVLGDKSISSNNVGPVSFPSLEVTRPKIPGVHGIHCFGKHALEWSRLDPGNLLAYEAYAHGRRFAYRALD